MIPHWSKDKGRQPINARAKTVASSGMFKGALAARRCIVAMTAFYEWELGSKPKQPYAFGREDRQPLALAGLWESWSDPAGELVRTFAITTTEANATLAPIHDRMPVVLEVEAWGSWLTDGPGDLLRPVVDDVLTRWKVSSQVNSMRNNGADLLEEVDRAGGQDQAEAEPIRRRCCCLCPPADRGQARLFLLQRRWKTLMTTNLDIADFIRTSFTKGMLAGMVGPTTFFADRFEVHYVPARSTDGWFDGQRLRDYQPNEYAIIRQVLPDAELTDVTVVPRADDQVVVIMTLTGTLYGGTAFSCPITMVYDVADGQIVRVIGLYNQQKLAPFADAFEQAARTMDIPTEMAPRR